MKRHSTHWCYARRTPSGYHANRCIIIHVDEHRDRMAYTLCLRVAYNPCLNHGPYNSYSESRKILVSHIVHLLNSRCQHPDTCFMTVMMVKWENPTHASIMPNSHLVYGARILPVSPFPCGLREASVRRQEAAVRFSHGFTGSARPLRFCLAGSYAYKKKNRKSVAGRHVV